MKLRFFSNEMSIVRKIFNLQTHGSYRTKYDRRFTKESNNSSNRVFNSLLPRLAFKLSDLLSLRVLCEEGHVFIGFTKDGQFIMSYTLFDSSDVGQDPLFKRDTYILHFWLFVPSRTLRKAGEVKLFGNDITLDLESSSLRIAVCQWPTDHCKILVYACNRDQWNQACDEEVECYMTVTAIPPTQHCNKCFETRQRLKSEDHNTSRANRNNFNYRCLKHSFVLHLQYHLLPPFPLFIPKMCLCLDDGTVVFNTGDTVYALSISVFNASEKPVSLTKQFPTSSACEQTNACQQSNSNPCIRVKNYTVVANDKDHVELSNGKHRNGIRNLDVESKENIVPAFACSSSSSSLSAWKKEEHEQFTKDSSQHRKCPNLEFSDFKLVYVQQEDMECDDDVHHGDDDTIYNNHLSLELFGSFNTKMRLLPKSKTNSWTKEYVCVEHKLCHVEGFVNAMVEQLCTSSTNNNKNLIFLDYYTQIIDVCPVSRSVYAFIHLLFESKDSTTKHLSFSWYKCTFSFQWNVFDGSCNLLHQSKLEEIDSKHKDRIKRNGLLWNPETLAYQTKYIQSLRPPSSYMNSVKVSTNEAVLRNESLKLLCEPYHGVAVVL